MSIAGPALLVVLHATAAFKHDLIDRNGTLRRMNTKSNRTRRD